MVSTLFEDISILKKEYLSLSSFQEQKQNIEEKERKEEKDKGIEDDKSKDEDEDKDKQKKPESKSSFYNTENVYLIVKSLENSLLSLSPTKIKHLLCKDRKGLELFFRGILREEILPKLEKVNVNGDDKDEENINENFCHVIDCVKLLFDVCFTLVEVLYERYKDKVGKGSGLMGNEKLNEVMIHIIDMDVKELELLYQIPFFLIEDLFESQRTKISILLWDVIECFNDKFSHHFYRKQGGLILLRICNTLLKRLSRQQHTYICGRILLFLASVYPICERSALNPRGDTNKANTTSYENEETFNNEISKETVGLALSQQKNESNISDITNDNINNGEEMEIETNLDMKDDMKVTAENSENADPELTQSLKIKSLHTSGYNLYHRFWSLQSAFADPITYLVDSKWEEVSYNLSLVLDVFNEIDRKQKQKLPSSGSFDSVGTRSLFLEKVRDSDNMESEEGTDNEEEETEEMEDATTTANNANNNGNSNNDETSSHNIDIMNCKYLTQPRLFHLQLKDKGMRCTILIQCLILLLQKNNLLSTEHWKLYDAIVKKYKESDTDLNIEVSTLDKLPPPMKARQQDKIKLARQKFTKFESEEKTKLSEKIKNDPIMTNVKANMMVVNSLLRGLDEGITKGLVEQINKREIAVSFWKKNIADNDVESYDRKTKRKRKEVEESLMKRKHAEEGKGFHCIPTGIPRVKKMKNRNNDDETTRMMMMMGEGEEDGETGRGRGSQNYNEIDHERKDRWKATCLTKEDLLDEIDECRPLSFPSFIEDYDIAEEMKEDDDLHPKSDSKYCWIALRLLGRENTSAISESTHGNFETIYRKVKGLPEVAVDETINETLETSTGNNMKTTENMEITENAESLEREEGPNNVFENQGFEINKEEKAKRTEEEQEQEQQQDLRENKKHEKEGEKIEGNENQATEEESPKEKRDNTQNTPNTSHTVESEVSNNISNG